MRGPCLLFSKVMLHYLKVFVFVIGCWTVNTGYLSSRATAHWEILVRFLWCFIICILLMCFQKYQLPDGMWSGKEQPARELQLLLFSIFSTHSVSLSLLVSLSLCLSLSLSPSVCLCPCKCVCLYVCVSLLVSLCVPMCMLIYMRVHICQAPPLVHILV